jgi:hypothetical protein
MCDNGFEISAEIREGDELVCGGVGVAVVGAEPDYLHEMMY